MTVTTQQKRMNAWLLGGTAKGNLFDLTMWDGVGFKPHLTVNRFVEHLLFVEEKLMPQTKTRLVRIVDTDRAWRESLRTQMTYQNLPVKLYADAKQFLLEF